MSAAFSHNDKPLSSVLLFAVEEDVTTYFTTLRGSYKARALEENDQFSLSCWIPDTMLVQASGHAKALTDKTEIEEGINKLVDVAASIDDFWPPLVQITGHDYVVYRGKLTWLRALDLTSPNMVELQSLYSEYTF